MQISDLRAWQWALMGVFFGLLYSCSLWFSGPWFDSDQLDTTDRLGFEHALLGQARHADPALLKKYHEGQSLLRNVVVHPPFRGDPVPNRSWVTGQLYSITTEPKDPKKPTGSLVYAERWTPFKYPTAVPYHSATEGPEHGKEFPTVTAFLTAANKDLAAPPPATAKPAAGKLAAAAAAAVAKPAAFPSYRYAWQELPAALWTLPAVAGLLVVGTALPLALGVMQSIGLMPAPVAKAPKPKPAPRQPAAKPTAPDAGVRVVLPPSTVARAPEPVGPNKKYGGEFYPVVKNTDH